MAEESVVRKEAWDVDARLAELGNGITRQVLKDVVFRATAAYAACTPHHPRNFAPISRWGNGTAALRDLLVPFSWTCADRNGQPLTVNPSGTLAITLSSADEHTGQDGEIQPRTSIKGSVTVEAVERNGFLFADMEADAEAKARAEAEFVKSTWFLLMYTNLVTGQVQAELSHPTQTDDERRVIKWSERLLLDPTDFDVTPLTNTGYEGPDDGDITIEFMRRA